MKTSPGQKLKIGIFTLVGIAVLVVGIFIIGNKKNMFGDTFVIYGMFRNVGGLQIGNNIRFAGINVGTVEDIAIENDTTVRVTMRLQQKVHKFLKVDAHASIGSDGLMGDKLVTIAPGLTGDKLLAEGGQIAATNPVDFDKIVAKLTKVADNAEIITSSLASISSEISGGKGSLGKLIYTDDLENGLQSTVTAAHETMKSVKKGTEGFSDNMDALKHNFLLKGYFKKKAKEDAKKKAEQEGTSGDDSSTDGADEHKSKRELRKERKEAEKAAKHGAPAADSTSAH